MKQLVFHFTVPRFTRNAVYKDRDKSPYPTQAKIQEAIILQITTQGVYENKNRPYRMIGATNAGIITTGNKV